MGYMRHHAIIVTSWDQELLSKARDQAVKQSLAVSEITDEATNGYHSFFVPPDGSKEGWSESDEGDLSRGTFISWLDGQRHEDDSTSLCWVEVQFGDDELETKITRDSDERRRSAEQPPGV